MSRRERQRLNRYLFGDKFLHLPYLQFITHSLNTHRPQIDHIIRASSGFHRFTPVTVLPDLPGSMTNLYR